MMRKTTLVINIKQYFTLKILKILVMQLTIKLLLSTLNNFCEIILQAIPKILNRNILSQMIKVGHRNILIFSNIFIYMYYSKL